MHILYKEAGMTMNTFIDNYKKEHNIDKVLSTKVCYSGRLDPMARGQVMILTGDECKKMDMYNKKDKTYTFEIIFGLSTDTDDVMGIFNSPILEFNNNYKIIDDIKHYIDIHIGTSFMQDFHDFSSIKYKGKSLWYYALNKIDIEKPKHMVTLYNAQYHDIKKYDYNIWRDDICMKINNIDRKNNFRQDDIIKQYNDTNLESLYCLPITITVSSGFYVRQLVNDIMNYIKYPILTHDINRINIII